MSAHHVKLRLRQDDMRPQQQELTMGSSSSSARVDASISASGEESIGASGLHTCTLGRVS